MVHNGFTWVRRAAYILVDNPFVECLRLRRRHGWVRLRWKSISCLSDLHPLGTSSRTLPWVITLLKHNLPADLDFDPDSPGAPVLASISKGVPGIFMDCHMMVSQPEKVRCAPLSSGVSRSDILRHEWVNDIADAGGSLYCFHIEATC